MARIAESKRADVPQTAARSQPGSCSSFDVVENLPHIDGHCHVFGQSLTGNPIALDQLHDALRTARSVGVGVAYPLLSFWDAAARFDGVKLLAYAMSREQTNALRVLNDIPENDEHRDGGAAVPLLLDMGFTPLDTKSFGHHALKVFDPDETYEHERNEHAGYLDCPSYYLPNRRYIWYPRDRDTYERTIRRLSEVARKYPGRFWPFVPFDPRRPDGLEYVTRGIKLQGYVGVKLYSRCGWMPLCNGEMHGKLGAALDDRLRELYTFCDNNDVPLLNHTSPTGFPPDGYLVFPLQYETTTPEVDAPQAGPGFPPYTMPTDKIDAKGRPTSIKPKTREECIRFGLIRAATYCHYIQKTTSPYAWDPVLREFPNLRLCLAHSGGEIATYCRYRDKIDARFDDDELESLRKKLHNNPMVASGAHFAGRDDAHLNDSLFVRLAASIAYVADGFMGNRDSGWVMETWNLLALPAHVSARRLAGKANDALFDTYGEMQSDLVAALVADEKWVAWLRAWRDYYKHDWTTKIIQLEQEHPYVYADIAYLAGEKKEIFCALVERLALDADKGGKMKHKHFIGTDWYMTAIDGMSAAAFWKRVQEVIPNESWDGGGGVAARAGRVRGSENEGDDKRRGETVWERWATKNALDFLNLDPRMNDRGMTTLEQFYDGTLGGGPRPADEAELPAWWPDVKCYYQRRPTGFEDVTEEIPLDDTVPDSVASDGEYEHAVQRLEETTYNLQNWEIVERVVVPQGLNPWRHNLTGYPTAAVSYLRIEEEGYMRNSAGTAAQMGAGVYVWEANRPTSVYIDLEFPDSVAVERITRINSLTKEPETFYRAIAAQGDVVPVRIIGTDITEEQLDEGREFRQVLGE